MVPVSRQAESGVGRLKICRGRVCRRLRHTIRLKEMRGLVISLGRQGFVLNGTAIVISCARVIAFVFRRPRGAATVISLSGGASSGRGVVVVYSVAVTSTAVSRVVRGSPTPSGRAVSSCQSPTAMTTDFHGGGSMAMAHQGAVASKGGRRRRSQGVARSQESQSQLLGLIDGRGRSRKIAEGLLISGVTTAGGTV